MATIRTCDRCGESTTVHTGGQCVVNAYAFDLYQPCCPGGHLDGVTTIADLCTVCAREIRQIMARRLPESAPNPQVTSGPVAGSAASGCSTASEIVK